MDLDELHRHLRINISEAQKRYQVYADHCQTPPPELQIGSQVFIHAKSFRTTRPSRKLAERNLGPYTVVGRVGQQSYTIKLPTSMHSVHPVFHISQLEVAHPNKIPGRTQPPPPPVEVDGQTEYQVLAVLDSRKYYQTVQYLVHWTGYENTAESESWQPRENLEHCEELVEDFHR